MKDLKNRLMKLAGLLKEGEISNPVELIDELKYWEEEMPDDFKEWREHLDADGILEEFSIIGEGQGRTVFDLKNETVLKLAKNPFGIKQNDEEIEMYEFLETPLLLPILHYSSKSWWYVVPKAKPLQVDRWTFFGVLPRTLADTLNNKVSVEEYKEWGGNMKLLKQLQELVKKANLIPEDIIKADSWGEWNGKRYLVDAGATESSLRYR